MKQSMIRQWLVLGAVVLTLALGFGFSYYRQTREIQIWPIAVLLCSVWGSVAIYMARSSRS